MLSLLQASSRIASRAPARAFATGTCKWFNISKGYGFITPDDKGQPDCFVHQSAVQMTNNGFRFLKENERVQYDVSNGERGVQAVNVRQESGQPFERTDGEGGLAEGGDRRREGGFSSGGPRRGGGGGGGERRPRRDSPA